MITKKDLTRVQLAADDLWRRIVGRPARRLQKVPVPHHVAQAKIRNLDVHAGIEEQVLGLQVPMLVVIECVSSGNMNTLVYVWLRNGRGHAYPPFSTVQPPTAAQTTTVSAQKHQ